MSDVIPLKQRLDADLKTAMLAKEAVRVSVLRGLKSAILYVEVAKGARDSGLPEDEVLAIIGKESKKRQESADLYTQGSNSDKAAAELAEKTIIDSYLPDRLSESEVNTLIDEVVASSGRPLAKDTMGATIAGVKQRSGGAADGALVAQLVKARIDK